MKIKIIIASLFLFAGTVSASTVCTTVDQPSTENVCSTVSTPKTDSVCTTDSVPTVTNVCHVETTYTTDKVCDKSIFGICYKWKNVQTPHYNNVCQDVTTYDDVTTCQDVTTNVDSQVCEDVTTMKPVENCVTIEDPKPEVKPVYSSVRIVHIPYIADYSFTKSSGIYDVDTYNFSFLGMNMTRNDYIKAGSSILEMEMSPWRQYDDNMNFQFSGDTAYFWVKNSDSTGKVLTVKIK